VQGFQGALLGERWQAERLQVRWDGGRQGLVLEGLRADGLQFSWRPHGQAWLGIQAEHLSAQQLSLDTGPASPPNGEPPQHIVPPLQLQVADVQLDRFVLDGAAPWQRLSITGFSMDPRADQGYAAQHLAFEAFGVAVEGRARLGPDAPLALAASATVRPLADGEQPRWAARLDASGSLARLALTGTLRGVPVATPAPPGSAGGSAVREAPMLDLQAVLQPLQTWKIAALSLRTQALDASALWAQAPATRLSGHAELSGGGRGRPLSLNVHLDNALPGRWNEQRLPVQALQVEAQGQLARPDRVELTRFDIALADGAGPAGRWTGSAVWQGPELTLDTVLASLSPQRLDGRAAAMTLGGPVALTLRGLPAPDHLIGDARAASASAAAPSLRWKVDLEGRLQARTQPVKLQLEGLLDDERLVLGRARAEAGGASADLQGMLTRAGGGAWQLATSGKVSQFDPLPWWAGDAGSTWAKGPHRLSGDWQLDLRLPANPDRVPLLAWAQRLAGNGRLSLHDSLLAGVPLSAVMALSYATDGAAGAATEPVGTGRPPPGKANLGVVHADLNLGGNTLVLDGRAAVLGSGEGDRWRLELQAERLASWAPLARLAPALAEWVPRQGSATAVATADGRWPALHTEGKARVAQLEAGRLKLARASASWQLDLRGPAYAEQPLSLQVEAAGLQRTLPTGLQQADHLRAELHGTMADHRIELSGAMPAGPGTLTAQVLGIEAQSGSRLRLLAQGAWRPDAAGGGRWQARIAQLQVGGWDGSPDSAANSPGEATAALSASWAEARDLKAELRFGGQGQLLSLQAEPGRIRLGEALALRWDAVALDLQPAEPQLQLHADIEPFLLAPLLARAWPSVGWQGDLRLAARVDIRASEGVDADLVFERRDGDLQVGTGENRQLLGLSEWRMALSAHGGLWTFTPLFRGRSLGEVSGQARVQTTPERRWPPPEAALTGELQLQVADVGIWSTWVPAGWRLGGELRSTAVLSGSFGQPQYTGELTGQRLAVRNLLEGVNITDGQLLVRLKGDTAQIERASAKGGDGSVTATGGATLAGNWPLKLKLQADRFRVLGRVDRNLTLSGDADLLLQADGGSRLDGHLRVDEGLYDVSRSDAPSLDSDVSVRRPGQTDDGPADAGGGSPLRRLALTLELDLGEKLRVRGAGLDTSLRGRLKLSSPNGRLAVDGSISTEGGTYAAYGQKLDVERGNISFSGSPENPRLDVLALRPNIDYRVGVQITGSVQTPRVKLYSEPDLTDAEKLSWMVTGRAPDSLGRNDTALLQRAAMALLAGEGEAPTDTLIRSLGLDTLSLRQSDTDVRETVVSLGKQINRRVYFGYERGVNATTGNWQLIYRIAQRFTLRLQSGLDNSADVIWTSRFQETPADAGTRKVTLPAK
jgi:translocation and assembly module TamB